MVPILPNELFLSAMRGVGLALRLALALFVVAVMDTTVFATLSLLQAVAALVSPIAAMGLHYKINRDIVDTSAQNMAGKLADRLLLNGLVALGMAICSAAAWAAIPGIDVSVGELVVFLGICILEVLLADAQNFLIACRKPVLAAVIYFVRNAAWVPLLIITIWVTEWTGLLPILVFWLAGIFAACVVMAIGLAKWPWLGVLRTKRSLRWQFADFRTASAIWLSDNSTAATPVIERSLLLLFLGPQHAGAYIFFWTLANGVFQLVSAGVIGPSMPSLVATAAKDSKGFRELVLKLSRKALGYWAVFAGAVLMSTAIGLPLMGKAELSADFSVLPILLIGMAVLSVADIFRLALYALGRDKELVLSNLGFVAINTGLVALFAFAWGTVSVAAAPMLASALIAALRWHWMKLGGIK